MYKFIIPLFALAFLLVSCTPATQTPPPSDSMKQSQMPAKAAAALASARASLKKEGEYLKGKQTVTLKTSKGDITLELNADAAPKTVTNFLLLAKAGYFADMTFHRVIPDFMIQGGDPEGTGMGGESIYGPEFGDEINAAGYGLDKLKVKDVASDAPAELQKLTMKEVYEKQGYTYDPKLKSLPLVRGAVAMANRGPNTNGSQFFIVQAKDVKPLEGKYTVFGKVTAGMDVVDAIVKVPRDGDDKPTTPVTFSATVE